MKNIALKTLIIINIVMNFIACSREDNEIIHKEVCPLSIDTILLPINDFDGNKYSVVKIGNQIWMRENLKSTHYADGSLINGVFVYNNDEKYINVYGKLYNWEAAMKGSSNSNPSLSNIQGICPNGWHLPSKMEWEELVNYLCGDSIAGDKMKDKAFWDNYATNVSLFSALPAGFGNGSGFGGLGEDAYFWSSTKHECCGAWFLGLHYYFSRADINYLSENSQYCIRCLKNQ